MTAIPIATTVRIPLTLEDQVQAMKKPVASIQAHQSKVNSLPTAKYSQAMKQAVCELTGNDICGT
jgi:hypothetical protein